MRAQLPRSEFTGQFRWGRVDSVDKSRHSVQVKFEEGDGFTSWDLQYLVTRPGDYSLPPANAMVLCLLVDGRLGVGFCLGAFYTDSDAAPLNDDGKRSIVSDDLRLGTSDASEKAAFASKCKQNFDDINTELTKIQTTLASLSGGASSPAVFGTPYTKSYSVTDPACQKVNIN
jgi:phage baseplate assembly protein gpV